MLISLGFIPVDAHILYICKYVLRSTPYGSQYPIYKVAPSPHGSTVLFIQNCIVYCMATDYKACNIDLIYLYNMLIMYMV